MATLTKIVLGYEPPEGHVDRIRERYPDLEVVVCPDEGRLAEVVSGAQAIAAWGRLSPEIVERAPDLAWYHATGAGVEGLMTPHIVDSDIILTNNSGIDAINIPEHILGLMLSFARRLPVLFQNQREHAWRRSEADVFELEGQTLAVVGLGDIGQGLARKAAGIGMRVVGLRRRPSGPIPGVERIYAPDELHQMLGEGDHVAICLPLTARTRNLFGPAEFRAMKPTAYIYNIGRGSIIDQDALIEALRTGEIGGAGLDVTTPEPLPADSPLWDLPNVIITPHTSGRSPNKMDRGLEILLDNIGRYRRDEPLRNLVDKREGY